MINHKEITTSELLDRLPLFPMKMIPKGVIRELASRQQEIVPELIARLNQILDCIGTGVWDGTRRIGFYGELLMVHPDRTMLPILKRILLADGADSPNFGDWVYNKIPSLLEKIASRMEPREFLDWLHSLLTHDSVNAYSEISIAELLELPRRMVSLGLIERQTGIDFLEKILDSEKHLKYELFPDYLVNELANFRAIELLPKLLKLVEAGKLDDYLLLEGKIESEIKQVDVPYKPWVNPAEDLTEDLTEEPSDFADSFKEWRTVGSSAETLDPYDISFETFSDVEPEWDESVAILFEDLRYADRGSYPYNSVLQLRSRFSLNDMAVKQLVDEVRWGLKELNEHESPEKDLHGAILAIGLLAHYHCELPSELVLSLIDLPTAKRNRLFGEKISGTLVDLLALSLRGRVEPVEQRLRQTDLDPVIAAWLPMFYPISAYWDFMTQNVATAHVLELLNSRDSRPLVSDIQVVESLAFLAPKSHADVINQFVSKGEVGGCFLSIEEIHEIVSQPGLAIKRLSECQKKLSNYDEVVRASQRFDDFVTAEDIWKRSLERNSSRLRVDSSDHMPVSTIKKSAARIGRNDPCHCGSGKKFKKCCLRNPVSN